ncbi:MAG: hypothetical protein ABSD69_00955 [Candidatus Levyibacteriota bacterium]|jgi:hypothetical protein
MKQERVILSFVAVLIGLLAAGIAFYFYQSTKTLPPSNQITVNAPTPTQTPKPTVYISLNTPDDETIVASKTLTINGKTNPNATIIIYTNADQQVIQPSSQGDFSTTLTLDDGENLLKLMSILPGGEATTIQRTVTYSTEDF